MWKEMLRNGKPVLLCDEFLVNGILGETDE